MLGVGIIGCGAVSKLHAGAFGDIKGVELKAVADVNEDCAKSMSKEFHVDCYNEYEKLLCREDIDIVSICTPSGLHEGIVVKAAKAGKHVIVEKPIEVTLEKIDHMINACKDNGVKLAGIFNNRYREGNIFVKKAIDKGRFGNLINVNVFIRWYREPDYYLKSGWRGTWSLDGGGALMNQGIHYVDLLLWLTGEVESVYAYKDTLLHKTIETEDTVAAIFRSKSGAIGSITAGTSIYPGFPARIEITGDKGSASISDGIIETWAFKDRDAIDEEAKLYMDVKMDNKRASDPMSFDCKYHKIQLGQIVEAFSNNREAEVNGEEARKSVRLICAIYESAMKSREIRL